MDKNAAIAIVGTFDSKGEEHLFLKKCIERRRIPTLTINVGTNGPSPFPADIDLYSKMIRFTPIVHTILILKLLKAGTATPGIGMRPFRPCFRGREFWSESFTGGARSVASSRQEGEQAPT